MFQKCNENPSQSIYHAVDELKKVVHNGSTTQKVVRSGGKGGGQCGRRFILPHSNTMIHEPLMRGGVGGSATSIR